MSRYNQGLMAAALLGLGLQALVVSGIDPRLDARLASNLLGICIALLATSSAIWAARLAERYSLFPVSRAPGARSIPASPRARLRYLRMGGVLRLPADRDSGRVFVLLLFLLAFPLDLPG